MRSPLQSRSREKRDEYLKRYSSRSFQPMGEEADKLCRACGGRCCSCIPYPLSEEDTREHLRDESLLESRARKRECSRDELECELDFVDKNWTERTHPESLRVKVTLQSPPYWMSANGDGHGIYYYTCKFFNESTGRCMSYESRPRTCRRFPFRDDPAQTGEDKDYCRCLLITVAKLRKLEVG